MYYPPNYKTPNLLTRPQFKGCLQVWPDTIVMHLNARNTHFSAVIRDTRGGTIRNDGARKAKRKANGKLCPVVELD